MLILIAWVEMAVLLFNSEMNWNQFSNQRTNQYPHHYPIPPLPYQQPYPPNLAWPSPSLPSMSHPFYPPPMQPPRQSLPFNQYNPYNPMNPMLVYQTNNYYGGNYQNQPGMLNHEA